MPFIIYMKIFLAYSHAVECRIQYIWLTVIVLLEYLLYLKAFLKLPPTPHLAGKTYMLSRSPMWLRSHILLYLGYTWRVNNNLFNLLYRYWNIQTLYDKVIICLRLVGSKVWPTKSNDAVLRAWEPRCSVPTSEYRTGKW